MKNKFKIELERTTRIFEESQRRLQNALLDLGRPIRDGQAWGDLYYGQPYAHNAEKFYETRLATFCDAFPGDIADTIRPLVVWCKLAARDVLTAKSKLKESKELKAAQVEAELTNRRSNGRYAYSTDYVQPTSDFKVGDVLLLAYGLGTQPARIVAVNQHTFSISRLRGRGTAFACWSRTVITRIAFDDVRILGHAILTAHEQELLINAGGAR